jgi:hypothetical protein
MPSMAMRLMTKHQITDAMIGSRGETKDEIGQITLEFTGIFGMVDRDLVWKVASPMGCKMVQHDATWKKPVKFVAVVTGWKTDLVRLEVLVASLRLQGKSSLAAWEKQQKLTGWMDLPRQQKYKDRRSFLSSFGSGVGTRLQRAFEQAVKEAAAERAEESHGTETEKDAFAGVAIALRDRKESVKDWYDDFYGSSLRSVHTRRAAGSYGASNAGYTAGQRADIGQHRVGGGRRAIGN